VNISYAVYKSAVLWAGAAMLISTITGIVYSFMFDRSNTPVPQGAPKMYVDAKRVESIKRTVGKISKLAFLAGVIISIITPMPHIGIALS